MDEIIKIIYENNKNRKLLSSEDIKKICFIVLKKNGYDFVEKVEVLKHNPLDDGCAGVYYRKNIFFFLKEMGNLIVNKYEEFTDMYKIDGAAVDVYNYLYLNIIIHELAHVRQCSIVSNKRVSLEKKIFDMFLFLTGNSEFYKENYNDILTEINANNVAMMTTNYIYSKLPRNFLTVNDWKVYQLYFLKNVVYDNYAIISHHDKILSPAERIIDKFDDKILRNLNISLTEYVHMIYDTNNFTIYKKLMLGLPIDYLEYAYVNLIGERIGSDEKINVMKKLQKKLNNNSTIS